MVVLGWLRERREEREVGLGSQIKPTSTVERHAASSRDIVALGAPFLDQLLGGDVASRKQNCSRHALGEIRTGCEPSIVPALMVRSEIL